jgi:hypothetical protein
MPVTVPFLSTVAILDFEDFQAILAEDLPDTFRRYVFSVYTVTDVLFNFREADFAAFALDVNVREFVPLSVELALAVIAAPGASGVETEGAAIEVKGVSNKSRQLRASVKSFWDFICNMPPVN